MDFQNIALVWFFPPVLDKGGSMYSLSFLLSHWLLSGEFYFISSWGSGNLHVEPWSWTSFNNEIDSCVNEVFYSITVAISTTLTARTECTCTIKTIEFITVIKNTQWCDWIFKEERNSSCEEENSSTIHLRFHSRLRIWNFPLETELVYFTWPFFRNLFIIIPWTSIKKKNISSVRMRAREKEPTALADTLLSDSL